MNSFIEIMKRLAASSFVPDFDPANIKTDAARMQFKSHGDSNGVTAELKTVTIWIPFFANSIMVWEALDGTQFIGDGHQRLGRSKVLETDYRGDPIRLHGYLLKEADGWTVEMARVICALKNIAEGGESTNPVDVARVLRNNGGDNSIFEGIIARKRKALQDGKNLSKLSDESFELVLSGHYQASWGAAVGELVAEQDRHLTILQLVKRMATRKDMTATAVRDMVFIANATYEEAEFERRQTSMFEILDASIAQTDMRIDFLEAALSVRHKARKVISSQSKWLSGAMKRDPHDLEQLGIQYSDDTRARIKDTKGAFGAACRILTSVTLDPELVVELKTAARNVMNGMKKGEAVAGFVAAVHAYVGKMQSSQPAPDDLVTAAISDDTMRLIF